MNEETKKAIRWLKKENLYENFRRNYLIRPNNFNHHNIDVDIKKSIEHLGQTGILDSSYKGWGWDKSFEGREFWNNVYNKYKYLKKLW